MKKTALRSVTNEAFQTAAARPGAHPDRCRRHHPQLRVQQPEADDAGDYPDGTHSDTDLRLLRHALEGIMNSTKYHLVGLLLSMASLGAVILALNEIGLPGVLRFVPIVLIALLDLLLYLSRNSKFWS